MNRNYHYNYQHEHYHKNIYKFVPIVVIFQLYSYIICHESHACIYDYRLIAYVRTSLYMKPTSIIMSAGCTVSTDCLLSSHLCRQ